MVRAYRWIQTTTLPPPPFFFFLKCRNDYYQVRGHLRLRKEENDTHSSITLIFFFFWGGGYFYFFFNTDMLENVNERICHEKNLWMFADRICLRILVTMVWGSLGKGGGVTIVQRLQIITLKL